MRDVIVMQRRTASGLEDVLTLGDIVASGSNANGDWVRWSDGTQVCRSTIELTGLAIQEGNIVWQTSQYTAPANFTGNFDVYIAHAYARESGGKTIYLTPTYGSSGVALWSSGRSPTNAIAGDAVRGTSGASYNVTSVAIRVVAIGKWK